ncbi:MAG: thioesterase family protein [Lentimicrobiaceae bacterium]|nr:thioesterase family protein [Lentimicrobiaceae bacterium]
MEQKLEAGIRGYGEQVVENKDTAKAYGSGLADVYATPAMIGLMENTAHLSIGKLLPEGYISVGTLVNIAHLRATPRGEKVWCETVLDAVEGRKLLFSVTAFDSKGVIGKGTHERCVVQVEKFMAKL